MLAELQRLVPQSQMEEYTFCARVCLACLRMPPARWPHADHPDVVRAVTVEAPRISICRCSNTMGFIDLSFSSLADLLPDRCTPEFRRVQAELGARHSFREAGRLLASRAGPVIVR